MKRTKSRALDTLRNHCHKPEESALDRDDFSIAVFSIAVFCAMDEALPSVTGAQRLRQRGPKPTLAEADREVLTMEGVGEYVGLPHDRALFAYFRRHYAHFFPGLRRLHRTTVVRQAANLWRLKERLWQQFAAQASHDEQFALVDSFPVPVCLFARASRCRRFRGEAAYGQDTVTRRVRPSTASGSTCVCAGPASSPALPRRRPTCPNWRSSRTWPSKPLAGWSVTGTTGRRL